MTKREYYKSVEAELVSLGETLSTYMDEKSSEQFQEFITVGEYGLALEELTGTLIDGGYSVSRNVFERIASLAKVMTIEEDHWKPVRVVEDKT